MRDVWLTALLKQPPRIMGRQLLAFSLSHSFILERAGNPYWASGACTGAALVEALDICSRTWEENAAWFDRPKFRGLKRLALAFHRKQSATAHAEFVAYLNDYAASTTREQSGEGRDMVSPWQFRIAAFLIAHGFTESQAWNMPMVRALCYFDAHDELEGATNLVEEDTASNYGMIAEANRLAAAGMLAEADKLYAEAQRKFDEKNGKAIIT